jgi:hypothetical protein
MSRDTVTGRRNSRTRLRKEPVQTLAEYDQQLEKELGGGTANSRPILSVVRTISE